MKQIVSISIFFVLVDFFLKIFLVVTRQSSTTYLYFRWIQKMDLSDSYRWPLILKVQKVWLEEFSNSKYVDRLILMLVLRLRQLDNGITRMFSWKEREGTPPATLLRVDNNIYIYVHICVSMVKETWFHFLRTWWESFRWLFQWLGEPDNPDILEIFWYISWFSVSEHIGV